MPPENEDWEGKLKKNYERNVVFDDRNRPAPVQQTPAAPAGMPPTVAASPTVAPIAVPP